MKGRPRNLTNKMITAKYSSSPSTYSTVDNDYSVQENRDAPHIPPSESNLPEPNSQDKSEEIFDVESVEGFMNYNEKPFYLIHWKDYDNPDEMTWEPEDDVKNCKEAIQNFWIKNSKSKMQKELLLRMKEKEKKSKSKKKKERQKQKEINARRILKDAVPDHIIDSRFINGKQQYFIKWRGFSNDYNSWVDQSQISNELIHAFNSDNTRPKIKQLAINLYNHDSVNPYNVLFSNGQLAWISGNQVDKDILRKFLIDNFMKP